MTWDGGGTYDNGGTFDAPGAVVGPPPGFTGILGATTYLDGIPQFGVTTMRIWNRLPERYRDADATAGAYPNDCPLLRFIALIGDQASDVETLLDRFSYVPAFAGGPAESTCDLVNPYTADPAWLPWLAQLVGVTLNPMLTVPEQQAAIANATSGWQGGSRMSIIAAAKTQLVGSQSVQLIDHYNNNQWQVAIVTRPGETPQPSTVVAAVTAAGAKPAGVQLVNIFYQASWQSVTAACPTWGAWQTVPPSDPLSLAGSWGALDSVPAAGGTTSWGTADSTYLTWGSWDGAGSWASMGLG